MIGERFFVKYLILITGSSKRIVWGIEQKISMREGGDLGPPNSRINVR